MADAKLTAATELTEHVSSDIIYIVDDPGGGTPLSRKMTIGNLFTLTAGEVIVLDSGSAAAPSIGWTDTGFYESSADTLNVTLGGTSQWSWGGGVVTSVWTLLASTVQSWRLDSSVASTTNPTLIPHRQSNDTGIGGNYPNILSLITAGVEAINIDANQLVSLDKTTQDAAFINFKATADGDATSAISTNTTSGSTTHHIQIEINGTTAWIAASTTDPS